MQNEEPDGALVEAWKAGDARAGETLFERYYDAVARFFFNKTDEASAQDLIQRTFLACIEGLPRLAANDNFRGYLFGVAYRSLCKHYERQARERGRLDVLAESVADLGARSPTQAFVAHEEQRLLLRSLRAIPLEHQVLLEWMYWEKLPVAEISAALQVPVNTVKTRLRRGRQLLAEAMARLADSPALQHSTRDDLNRWAAELRLQLRGKQEDVRSPTSRA
jgi:RNA polymerase sigma-70 factor (ECF subfamily)